MDIDKHNRLVEELSQQPEPQVVPIDRFFDGNDDIGSMGCNLINHPGMDAFRSTFEDLLKRPDVEAIYAEIAELDPGDDSWPFSDTVFVVGTIPVTELRTILKPLKPDEVAPGEEFALPDVIARRHSAPVYGAWWD